MNSKNYTDLKSPSESHFRCPLLLVYRTQSIRTTTPPTQDPLPVPSHSPETRSQNPDSHTRVKNGSDGRLQPPEVPLRTDHTGMRSPSRGPHPATGESLETPRGQNVGLVPVRSPANARDSAASNTAGRLVPETSGDLVSSRGGIRPRRMCPRNCSTGMSLIPAAGINEVTVPISRDRVRYSHNY
jgi:hypothetical protein